MTAGRARFEDNPFHVLGLGVHATRADVEREGQKLLGMLELGLAGARSYVTPVGETARTPEKVRRAMAELRDPERRLLHEMWFLPAGWRPSASAPETDGEPKEPSPGPWGDAMAALGFGKTPMSRSVRARGVYLLWILGGPIWLGLAAACVFGHASPTVAALVLALVPLFFPWPIARWLFVPLGMPRAAEWISRTPDRTWMRDPRGGSVLAGAWASLRAREHAPETATWLEERLRDDADVPAAPLRGAGVVASGLLAASRGDVATARELLESARHLDPAAMPPAAARIAGDWLVADAASRGDWDAVADRASWPHAGGTTRLLAAIAARLLHREGAPTPSRIWILWAASSARSSTLPLVRRAVEATPSDGPRDATSASERRAEPRTAMADVEATAHERALRMHAALVARPPSAVTGDMLAELADAWDTAFADRGARRNFEDRAAMLGVSEVHAAAVRQRAGVDEDLSDLARVAGVTVTSLHGAGGAADRAAARLRDEVFAEVELAATALRARLDDRRELPPIDEWREFLALRATYDRAVALGGDDVRRLAFSRAKNEVWAHAYQLSNGRSESTLAHAMYAWLLAEARALDDARILEPLEGNVEATAATGSED